MISTTLYLLFCLLGTTSLALENGLARTPPMGWMSWSAFHCQINCDEYPDSCINEQLYMQMADRLVADGYRDAGYVYVNIDDCWAEKQRSMDGKIVANRSRFPSGIDGLAKYMHDRGLKLGIYGDVGHNTCGGYPGSWQHETIDAQTFADWGFSAMRDALARTGRPIVYSTEWDIVYVRVNGTYNITTNLLNYTQISETSNLNRQYTDVQPASWEIVLNITDYFVVNQDKFIPVSGPGFWSDPDVIIAGLHFPNLPPLTLDQSRAQMSIWAIWSAPFLISNDLRNLTAGAKELLLNKYVISVDQDSLGVMGRMVAQNEDIMTFVKKMTPFYGNQYSYAIALFNRGPTPQSSAFKLSDIGLTNPSGYNVMDLWAGQIVGSYGPSDTYTANVPATGVHFIKAIVVKQ